MENDKSLLKAFEKLLEEGERAKEILKNTGKKPQFDQERQFICYQGKDVIRDPEFDLEEYRKLPSLILESLTEMERIKEKFPEAIYYDTVEVGCYDEWEWVPLFVVP